MIRFELAFGLMVLGLGIFSLITVIQTPDDEVQHLPKVGWLLLVLFFPLVGSIAWLVAGRPQRPAGPSRHERSVPDFPEYDRPGRAAATNPEADAAFLRRVRERAEEQRRAYREAERDQMEE
jgi:hypothetical protein